ncbi:MAG: hypothetical protein ACTSWX_14220 [Promethearchaeota archaeon]
MKAGNNYDIVIVISIDTKNELEDIENVIYIQMITSGDISKSDNIM